MPASRLLLTLFLAASPLILRADDSSIASALTIPAPSTDKSLLTTSDFENSTPIGAATDTPVGDTSLTLRGYGRLKVSRADNAWTFEATSPVNAATTVGKFLADLNLSPGVTVAPLDVNGLTFQMTTVPGGLCYTGYVTGSTGHVVAAKDQAGLQALLGDVPKSAVTNPAYPPYLDRFDRHGWGFYGFDSNFAPAGKERDNTDPLDDMAWLAKYNFRFELWPQPTEFDDSYSIPIQRNFGWLLTEAQKLNVPVSARLYGRMPHAKEFTDTFDLPRPFVEGGWYWSTLDWRMNHRMSWFSKPGRLYMARQAQDEIKLNADHPEIESWMQPYGEIGTYDWYMYHGDVSPAALADWHDTIENKDHLSLDELSKMFLRGDKPFRSYDEVPIPEIGTFAGLPGEIQDLEGDWYVKQEPNKGDGLAGQWWGADTGSGWDKLHLPGSVFWFKYNTGNRELPKWVIRDFNYDPARASGKPVYLYDFARATVNDPRNLMPVYLNGEKLGDVANWTAWDVSKLLKPGMNRLAFECEVFTGRVFLSTDTPALYPYLGAERNKLWVTFNDWLIDGRWGAVNNVLAGMRMVEPNKPIKIMAPPGNDNDRWLDAASKYGAWGHFTGEGIWAYFWYKRYGFLYGLPGTSEGAGPAGSVRDQFNVYERVFLEGLNGHDTVFNVQNITRVPELKQWFEDHIAVLKQMGRYDISGPQVILYRSASQAAAMMPPPTPGLAGNSHQIQSIWNWDFARGTFQEIGQSGLYVDNGGLASHKIDRYRIMLDAGNEIVTPAAIRDITAWVKNGGTYITLPFTGRSNVAAPDSWPIQALTGCEVTKLRTPGTGTVTIAKDQPIFKDLAGQSFPDAGRDMDWQNVEYNSLSTELKPGADCTVLATFEDGAPAIVLHKLGQGQVISLGSVFFRDVQDVKGLWISGEREENFLRDLFNGLGQPAVNDTSDLKVVTQRYRTQNGLDDVVVMQNFDDGDRTVDLHATLDHPPAKVYQVAMNEIKEVPFTASGNVVTVSQVAIPKDETQVFYFRSYAGDEAFTHWWQYQNKLWKPTVPTKLDFSSIDSGRWIDPTVDLKQNWYWTQDTPANDDWTKDGGRFASPGGSGSAQPWVLDIFTAVGADSTRPLYARRSFHVKPEWIHDGGVTTLRAQGQFFDFGTWGTRWQLWVNGQLLKSNLQDVSSMLKPGDNTIAIKLEPQNGCQYLGVQGSLYLSHTRPPSKIVDLSGQWTNDANATGAPLTFPGKGSGFAPTRWVDIPADWKDKYIVCYYAQGDPQSAIGTIVNETGVVAKRTGGPVTEVDITPYLKFGEKNELSMLSTGGDQLDPTHNWDIAKVELHLYPRSEYRN
jgi:hypothetical protein